MEINQRLIPAPPILQANSTTNSAAKQFPIGHGFVAENVKGQLILWGGAQKQPDGQFNPLPQNVMYSFTPHDLSGVWEVMEATGEVHPGNFDAAYIVLDSKIYIQGGEEMHYGTKPGHFETSKIHFPPSEGVSEVSERANE